MARRTIVLVVALLLAAIAAFAVWQFLTNVQEEAEADLELVPVYRAQDFIAEGLEGDLIISQGRAVESQEELRFVPVNAITNEDQLRQALSGRVAAGPISQNSILTADQWVALTVDVKPLAESIPVGKQAMTILVDDERGVNGFIQPGDRVNLIVTIDVELRFEDTTTTGQDFTDGAPTEPEEQRESKTLTRYVLQGIPVLAVGRDIRPEEDAEANVVVPDPVTGEEETVDLQIGLLTLEVTPEQAEKLAYSYENASVWLTLVPTDFFEVETEGVTIDNLFDDLGILEGLIEP